MYNFKGKFDTKDSFFCEKVNFFKFFGGYLAYNLGLLACCTYLLTYYHLPYIYGAKKTRPSLAYMSKP